MKWSRKVATKKAAEQSDALRRVFQARVQQNYTAEQLIAIDESACNERTGDRKYGWGPVGRSVELEYSIKRPERWSLLPAMTVDGYLTHHIFQGAITTELMLEFLQEDVLPRCTPGYHVLLLLLTRATYFRFRNRAIGRCNTKILSRYKDLSYLRSFTDVGCGWDSTNANKSDVVT